VECDATQQNQLTRCTNSSRADDPLVSQSTANRFMVIAEHGGYRMAKRHLSFGERNEIGKAMAAKSRVDSRGRTIRVLVAPLTNETGEPQVTVTSVPTKGLNPPKEPIVPPR
jgi:hypothetical protein